MAARTTTNQLVRATRLQDGSAPPSRGRKPDRSYGEIICTPGDDPEAREHADVAEEWS